MAYGQVITASGDPVDGAIVYLELEDGVTSCVDQSQRILGDSLSTARSSDLTNFAAYDRDWWAGGSICTGGEDWEPRQ